MNNTEAPVRRKQTERTAAMRTRLLNATLDLISEGGWANASMQRICERAGVSRGAQTHHFPTRESLLIASVHEILSRYQHYLDLKLQGQGEPQLNLREFFDFLWDACFNDALVVCWIEAMVAARHDAPLRQVARTTDQKSLLAIKETGNTIARGTQPEPITPEGQAADIVELTVYLLRGFVIQDGVHHSRADHERLYNLWVKLVLPILES
jgi:AcrR family transcriptional regulator